jgi:hypothetical protein
MHAIQVIALLSTLCDAALVSPYRLESNEVRHDSLVQTMNVPPSLPIASSNGVRHHSLVQ